MIENVAEMTNVEMERSPVDIIVMVTDDVPSLVSLNHSYTYRVSLPLKRVLTHFAHHY